MTMQTTCKEYIIKWIADNPGYVYSQFTFILEEDEKSLPTVEEFELLIRNVNSWSIKEDTILSEEEQELYPGATQHHKYVFDPLNENLYAHVFLNDDIVLYVVVGT